MYYILCVIYTIYNDTITGIITNTISDYRMNFFVIGDSIKLLL